MESILTSVKKMLGISEEYDSFDADIIMHINSVFSVLTQLGAGPSGGFTISDSGALWSDYLQTVSNADLIKSYMFLKVKLLFDPPLSSSVAESYKRQVDEFEWRITVLFDKEVSQSESV